MIKIKDIINIPSLNYHIQHGLTLHENVYRYSSEKFIQLFAEAREALRDGKIQLNKEDLERSEEHTSELHGLYEGEKVPLDLPTVDEAEYRGKDVPLNKPKRGGPKKFVVYTKNDNFGGTTGLNVKIDEPGARASFAARHKCAQKKDKTKPGYWACNIGRYWKSLGGKRNFSGYW